MTTTYWSNRELATQMETVGLRREVVPGDVYWVPNSVLRFGDWSDGNFHAAVVTDVRGSFAKVCVRTSQLSGKNRAGVFHEAQPSDGLSRQGVILTRRFGCRRVPVSDLKLSSYLCNVGLGVLLLIWVSMWAREPNHRVLASPDRGYASVAPATRAA